MRRVGWDYPAPLRIKWLDKRENKMKLNRTILILLFTAALINVGLLVYARVNHIPM